jgi:hypothetical protein
MYGFHATLDMPFDKAVDAVTAALKAEGLRGARWQAVTSWSRDC